MKTAAAAIFFASAVVSGALAETGELKAFAACPVYRDTDDGIKSGCWLATDPETGIVYDVSRAPTKPDWNFGVLVEGYVEEGAADTCGGVVLNPMRLSLLRDRACVRRVLPAEDYPGVKFRLPGRTVQPLYIPRKPPEPPHEDVTFNLFFDYNRDFLVYQLDDYLMDDAANHIVSSSPKKVTVTGYAVREPYEVAGGVFVEKEEIAKARAETVAEALRRMGVPAELISIRTAFNPEPVTTEGTGDIPEASRRRADIFVDY
ncbi:hypothetical protein [Hyphococcus sp.]|jgi:hypothetical protein|uniref:hypothetical protein n=1 Tax=Hyphococcus sp. TaxID=2038636 RepID=UPI003D13F3EB